MTPYIQMLWNRIPVHAQGAFDYEYRRYAKDPTTALMLTIALGLVGGEAYYFGDYKRGILMTLALLSGVGLIVSVPIWITRCITISNECDAYNEYLAYALALHYIPANAVKPSEPEMPPHAKKSRTISGVPMRIRTT